MTSTEQVSKEEPHRVRVNYSTWIQGNNKHTVLHTIYAVFTAVGAAKTMPDGSEHMVNTINVPSDAAENVDCKMYV